MNVEFERVEDCMIQFKCTDYDDTVYGVADSIQNGMIVDTLVLNMETYDEVEDSELFKRIVTARAIYVNDNADVLAAMNEI